MKTPPANNYTGYDADTRLPRWNAAALVATAWPEEKGNNNMNILKNAQGNYRFYRLERLITVDCPAKEPDQYGL